MYQLLSQIYTSIEPLHVAQTQKMQEQIIHVAWKTSMEGCTLRVSVEVCMSSVMTEV
jgi:hypothetical protein